MTAVSFKPVADHAVLVGLGGDVSDATHETIVALDKALAADPPPGFREAVPALVNLLIDFDPMVTDHAAVARHAGDLLAQVTRAQVPGRQRIVEVCYEPPFCTDLDAVAEAAALSREAVVNMHLAGDYKVLMYGFSPGYAYLTGVREAIRVPRKQAALRGVAAGSVVIADKQCLVTTVTMPTGWSILGRSPTRILTGEEARPFLFDVGDTVAFERIDTATFERLSKERAVV